MTEELTENIEITDDYKLRCVQAIRDNEFRYKTNKAQAISLDLNASQFSRLLKGEISRVISDKSFKKIGNKYNVPIEANIFSWETANTKVFNHIFRQLEACQDMSISGLFCDKADIGKSAVAKHYVMSHRNAILVDCSIHKSRTKLLRAMSKELGLPSNVPLRMLQRDLIQYLNTCSKPLVILDEMGDLEYAAFLEIKALWNATENRCGWYGMGADGLQHKIDRQIDLKRVGYAEVFRRFGSRYQHIIPKGDTERKHFLIDEIKRILKVNKSKLTPLQMYAKTKGSLTRVYIEIKKEILHEPVLN